MNSELKNFLAQMAFYRDRVLDKNSPKWEVAAMLCCALDSAIFKYEHERDEAIVEATHGPLVPVVGSYEEGFAAGVRAAMALAKVTP